MSTLRLSFVTLWQEAEPQENQGAAQLGPEHGVDAQQRRTAVREARAVVLREVETIPRLDARYDWLGWNFRFSSAFGETAVPLVDAGDLCAVPAPALVAKAEQLAKGKAK